MAKTDDKTFTLFWLTGQKQLITGADIESAMRLAGIGGGAMRALDFWATGDCCEYEWDGKARSWTKITVTQDSTP